MVDPTAHDLAEAGRMLREVARAFPAGSRAEQSKARRLEGAAVAFGALSGAVSDTADTAT